MAKFFTSAIIVAAGTGSRFGSEGLSKQFQPLGGQPMVRRTIETFLAHPQVNEVIGVVPHGLLDDFQKTMGAQKDLRLVPGGEARHESTNNGFKAISPSAEVVLVHDGVRPLVEASKVSQLIMATHTYGAAILAVPVRDTLKKVDENSFVASTVDRNGLWQAQTPQGFTRAILEEALSQGAYATDEAFLVESLGHKVKVVQGAASNFKITLPEDLEMAEKLINRTQKTTPFRVGQGWDFHRMTPHRPLWLGCIHILGEPGLSGHSDADVLAHSLVDALLGGAALGDIGHYFPDHDHRWHGVSGSELISRTISLVRKAGFELVNADMTIIGERPRIAVHSKSMLLAISKALGVDVSMLNLKGTTTEGLGFTGRREGLAATSTVLLIRA